MASSKATRYFPCPVERVWRTVTDLSHTAWRRGLCPGGDAGQGPFRGAYQKRVRYPTSSVTACQPPRFWAFTMENSSMAGRWEGRFQAADGGTWLTCAETITAKRWWMRPFVPGYLKRQQKLYLDDLQKELRKESPRLFNEA